MNVEFWKPGSIHGDEYYTREEDADIIADNLLPIPMRVWCPFNDTNSAWVSALEKRGHEVIVTDTDFFETEPPDGVQCIISNPPFTLKKAVMDRIKELDLRFCLILPFQWLNDGVPLEYGRQLMFFRQRMFFNTPSGVKNKPRANCFVLSDGLLKHNLTFVDKRNTKDNHTKEGDEK